MSRRATLLMLASIACGSQPLDDSSTIAISSLSPVEDPISSRSIGEWMVMERDIRTRSHTVIGTSRARGGWRHCLDTIQVPERAHSVEDAMWLSWKAKDAAQVPLTVTQVLSNPVGGEPNWASLLAQVLPPTLRSLATGWPAEYPQPGFLAMGTTESLPCLQHGFREQTYKAGPGLYMDPPVWSCYTWEIVLPGASEGDLHCLTGLEVLTLATGSASDLKPLFAESVRLADGVPDRRLRFPAERSLRRVWIVPVGLVTAMASHRYSGGVVFMMIGEDNQTVRQALVIPLIP